MKNCTTCGSYAINHHLHGRDGTMPDKCDVCYWREQEKKMSAERDFLRNALVEITQCNGVIKKHLKETIATMRDIARNAVPDYIKRAKELRKKNKELFKKLGNI